MSESAAFLEALKRCLKAKGVTYLALAQRLELSEASVKRIFAEGTLSLERIGQILEVLGMSFHDVGKLSSSVSKRMPNELTYDQESVLAADPKLFAVFHLLLFGNGLKQILETYQISRKDAAHYLRILSDLELIEQRGPLIKMLVGKTIIWRDDGPLRATYRGQILNEFLANTFDGIGEANYFVTRSLSPGSQAIISRKLELLRSEMDELSAVDNAALKGKTQVTALLVAVRPFSFSVVNALKKRS